MSTKLVWTIICLLFTAQPSMSPSIYAARNLKLLPNTSWRCTTPVQQDNKPSFSESIYLDVSANGPFSVHVNEKNMIECWTSDDEQISCGKLRLTADMDASQVSKLDCQQLTSSKTSPLIEEKCITQSKETSIINYDKLGKQCGTGHVWIPDSNGVLICSHCCKSSRYNRGNGHCEKCPPGHTTNKDGLASRCHLDYSSTSQSPTTPTEDTPSSTVSTPSVAPTPTILAPYNLEAGNLSADSVNLTWSIHHPYDYLYQIHLCSVGQTAHGPICKYHNTFQTFLIVRKLTPKSMYAAKVRVLKMDGGVSEWSDEVSFATKRRPPSVKVENIQATYNVNLTKVSLKWENPDHIDDEMPYLGYRIICQSEDDVTIFTSSVNYITYTIKENAMYEFFIQIWNSEGSGPKASYRVSVPAQGIPKIPERLPPETIAGIVGLVMVVFAILIIALFCCLCKRHRRCHNPQKSSNTRKLIEDEERIETPKPKTVCWLCNRYNCRHHNPQKPSNARKGIGKVKGKYKLHKPKLPSQKHHFKHAVLMEKKANILHNDKVF